MPVSNAGRLTDAQARNLAIKALRQARTAYRKSDTAGEAFEREIDRLIKRKTRINAGSFATLADLYSEYIRTAERMQSPLQDAFDVASSF